MQATLSHSDLVNNLEMLSSQDYFNLITTVNNRRSQRYIVSPLEREAILLSRICVEFSEEKWQRMVELNEKVGNATITEEEYAEQEQLIEESETYAANRLMLMAELAAIRQVDYPTLVKQLGIQPRN